MRLLRSLKDLLGSEPPPQVLHHHIPKTAGTSFNSYLDTLYGKEDIMPKRWIPNAAADPRIGKAERYHEVFRRFRLIHGHISLLPEVPDEWVVVTFLRPPVRRVVSLISDWGRLTDEDLQGLPKHNRETKIQARNASIVEMLNDNSPLVRQHLHNGMCKSLLSRLYPTNDINRMSDEELAKTALMVIEQYMDFVGDASEFGHWASCFSKAVYGRSFKSRIENQSLAGSRYDTLNSQDLDNIQKFNAADIGLYEGYASKFGWTEANRKKSSKEQS